MKSATNFISILIIYSLFVSNIIISVYFFTNGFLIRRLALNDTNKALHPELKRFDKAIVLFVDALRFDFIFTNRTKSSSDLFGISTIENLIQNETKNAKLFKFISDVSQSFIEHSCKKMYENF
jgi:phosphatidylinositol glycan class O